jgi:hypothetical protein
MVKQAKDQLEVWMRGPISGISPFLQPVAHALLQIDEDIQKQLTDEIEPYLWIRPFEMANIAFHVQHIAGVIQRIVIYSKGEYLTEEELQEIKLEGIQNPEINNEVLKDRLHEVIEQTLTYLKSIDPNTLADERFLGRKKIPTTQIGLLFHAAEHGQRHFGQLLVTIKTVKGLFLQGSIH